MTPAVVSSTDSGSQFYRIGAVCALAVATAGFYLTYLHPVASGTFAGPSLAHLHGAVLAAWLVLVIAQAYLVRRRLRIHRKLGWIAVALAPTIAVTTVLMGAYAARRDMPRFGEASADQVLGTLTTPLAFLLLVALALLLRRKPAWHKRLILLATVTILWPAWFRWRHFLPAFPRPDIWLGFVLAETPIVVAAVRDRWRFGSVHPAYRIVGTALIAEQAGEIMLFGTAPWHRLAMGLLEVLP